MSNPTEILSILVKLDEISDRIKTFLYSLVKLVRCSTKHMERHTELKFVVFTNIAALHNKYMI